MLSKTIINMVVAAGLALIVWLVVIPAWTGVSELRKEVSLKKKSDASRNQETLGFICWATEYCV